MPYENRRHRIKIVVGVAVPVVVVITVVPLVLVDGTEEDLLSAARSPRPLPMLVVDFLLFIALQLGPLLLLSGLARRAVTPVECIVPVVNVYLLLMQCGGPFPVFTPHATHTQCNKPVLDCLDCLDLHYAKPKGEPVSEERYN